MTRKSDIANGKSPAPNNIKNNIMEENIKNDAEIQPEVATEQPTVVEQPKTEKPARPRRKNGRNSRAATSQAKASAQQLSCGEISGISSESEKLSGSNVNGYVSEKKKEADTEAPQVQNSEEKSESKQSEESEQHNGPSFEQKRFTPRTIEVSLEDRRPKNTEDKKLDGVVSYSAADEASCPPVSLFARIKAALKSIFGSKKSKKSSKKNGKKFDKNNKKDFKGKKKFNKNFNKDGKNFNRRHQNRGNRRPQGNNKPQQ